MSIDQSTTHPPSMTVLPDRAPPGTRSRAERDDLRSRVVATAVRPALAGSVAVRAMPRGADMPAQTRTPTGTSQAGFERIMPVIAPVPPRRTFLVEAMNRVVNPVVCGLLRSPAHGILSGGLLLVTVRGRRSGRLITLPVQYVRRDNVLYVLSRPDRRWWRNVGHGAPVSLTVAGCRYTARGTALEGAQALVGRAAVARCSLERALEQSTGEVIVAFSDLQAIATEGR